MSKLIYFCDSLGILTKPDGLQDGDTGSREAWRKTLAGEDPERKTKHGYYCVRLPTDQERKGGREKSQTIEEEFFNSCTPWNDMTDRSKLGVPNFVQDISALLVELIEK
jgi:vacuolar protein sorting-associated protein 1